MKEHVYFLGIDWNSLLRMKADFIPQLEDDDDTLGDADVHMSEERVP